MSTQGHVMRYARGGRRRKGVLNVDLNVPPAIEIIDQVGGGPAFHQSAASSSQPTLIDVEEIDDDVVISSPRAFEEAARNKSRRTLVVDVESGGSLRFGNKRRRGPTNPPVINCEHFVNLEGSNDFPRGRTRHVVVPPPPPPPPPPPEPTFSCPVCMGPLVEEVTTKCGHIFCKGCIKAAISAQSKCPTCRRKVTNKDIIRVYLPTSK